MSEARSPCSSGFYVICHHSPTFQAPSLPTAAHAKHPGSHSFRANTDNESTRTSSSYRSQNVTVRLAMDGARSSSDHSLLQESRLAPVRLTSSPVTCPRSIWVSDNAAEDLIVAMAVISQRNVHQAWTAFWSARIHGIGVDETAALDSTGDETSGLSSSESNICGRGGPKRDLGSRDARAVISRNSTVRIRLSSQDTLTNLGQPYLPGVGIQIHLRPP
jgi:hypothetical protein